MLKQMQLFMEDIAELSLTLSGYRSMRGAMGSFKLLQVAFITVPSWLCWDKGTTQNVCSAALVWAQHPAEKSFLLAALNENCFLTSLWHCSNKHTVSFREYVFTVMLFSGQNYSVSSVFKMELWWSIIILIDFTCYSVICVFHSHVTTGGSVDYITHFPWHYILLCHEKLLSDIMLSSLFYGRGICSWGAQKPSEALT